MGGQVPQTRRVIVATGHDPMVVRADGHGVDVALVAAQSDSAITLPYAW